MSREAVELDFFGLEKEKSSSSSSISKSLDRRRSSRSGIQNAISKINPELLKSVITSTAFSAPSTPRMKHNALPPLPVHIPFLRPTNVAEIGSKETAPLTIFYNGSVTVFDLCPDKAENILKLAAEASSKIAEPENKNTAAPSTDQQQLLGTLSGDLPLFRRKSLQRFLEKRKERLTSLSPMYACDDHGGRGFGKKTTSGGKFGVYKM